MRPRRRCSAVLRGLTEMEVSAMPNDPTTYSAEASAADIALDISLSEVRAAQDNHDVTCREAADMRITLLEDHLAKIRALRIKYWGDSTDE